MATEDVQVEVPTHLTQLAVTFYTKNAEMNAAKKVAEKARKELYGGMKEVGLLKFDLETNIDGKPFILDAEVGTGNDRTVIDVEKLFKRYEDGKLSRENLISMLSATKKAVEEGNGGGKELLAQVSHTESGTENVSVKPRKA